jgi:hypothetical protein
MSNKAFSRVSLLVLGLSFSLVSIAQVKPQVASPVASAVVSHETKWEYLVVSYGKTFFGSPEKTLAYRSIGLAATAQEANEIQQSLDILGRFGWEVITVVGAIGGDQQIVLKRIYDKNRAANEGLAILAGRELYLKDLVDILERARRVREASEAANAAARNQPKLVDLDEKEAEERRAQWTLELTSKVKAALADIAGVKDPTLSARVFGPIGEYKSVEIKIDLTGLMLKDGVNYRASEVKNWLDQVLLATLKRVLGNPGGSLDITASAVINFNGKAEKVGEQKARYSSILKRWD